MLSSEQQLAYSLLCCINQTPDSNLTHLWIFIHYSFVFLHLITVMIQINFFVSLSSIFCMCTFHSITAFNPLQKCNETDSQHRCKHVPSPCHFVSKMLLRPMSLKTCPYSHLPKSMLENTDKADIIIRQVSRMFGVMRPSMWMIFHRSNTR